MKICLLGATGRVGKAILELALQDGHEVKALVRNPEKLNIKHENLRVFTGNVLNLNELQPAINQADIVISTLGTDGGYTLSKGTANLLQLMRKEGVKRVMTIGTAGILDSRSEPSVYRFQSSESKLKLTRASEEHLKAYFMLINSRLDWTIICPTYLPDGEKNHAYRLEKDRLPIEGKEISVGDTSQCLFNEITNQQYLNSRVGICY
jgi:putative NADH-flavin reductase